MFSKTNFVWRMPGLIISKRLECMLLIVVGLAGCSATPPHMIPAPAVYSDARLNMHNAMHDEVKKVNLPVFYATSRQAISADQPGHYNEKVADQVTLGVADVRLGQKGWDFDDLIASDYDETWEHARPGEVESVLEFGKADDETAERHFVAAINAQIAASDKPDVSFYVHGYRVHFDEATVLMGSVGHYLGHNAMVTFQWPTGLNFWNYLTDCPRAEAFISDIADTIELLAKTDAEAINMLAYSCGSPILAAALDELRRRYPELDRQQLLVKFRIADVIFAASDVDLKTFANEYIPSMLDLSRQLTVYYSEGDGALRVSGMLAGASRLGRPKIDDLTPAEIEVLATERRLNAINVTDVPGVHEMGGMAGHGYWYANSWISTDVLVGFLDAIPPGERCLVLIEGARNTWRFPENYVDCVVNKLLTKHPQLAR